MKYEKSKALHKYGYKTTETQCLALMKMTKKDLVERYTFRIGANYNIGLFHGVLISILIVVIVLFIVTRGF